MNIHLHIERLVIDGLPVTNAGLAQVQAVLEGEIRSALRFSALPEELRVSGATFERAATMDFDVKDKPHDVGRRISHAICRSLALQPAPAQAGNPQPTARGTRR
jgi:hypothetical protein